MNNATEPANDRSEKFQKISMESTLAKKGLSANYRLIDTSSIVRQMQTLGFEMVHYSQTRVRTKGRDGFQKHLIYLCPAADVLERNEVIPLISVTNSHDGTTALRLCAGMYRLVCSNGLIVGEGTLSAVRIIHRDYSAARLEKSVEGLLRGMGHLKVARKLWSEFALSPAMANRFAHAAVAIRWPVSQDRPTVAVSDLLAPIRAEDNGNSLWHILNRVQEKKLLGGFEACFKSSTERRRVRRIQGIDSIVRINRGL